MIKTHHMTSPRHNKNEKKSFERNSSLYNTGSSHKCLMETGTVNSEERTCPVPLPLASGFLENFII